MAKQQRDDHHEAGASCTATPAPKSRSGPRPPSPAALAVQILLLLLTFFSSSHILTTPLNQQADYCATSNGRDSGTDSFPCEGTPLERARFLFSHLYLGFSGVLPVLAAQVMQLAGMLLLVVDLLKIWPQRARRLFPGPPTTVHSPVRQAVALAARLGCVLLQIICIIIDHVLHKGRAHRVVSRSCGSRGTHVYTLSKARSVWLGHTVNACLSYRLPLDAQRWAGALEVVLVLVASGLASGRPPTRQEAPQFLVYSLIMYFVPLLVSRWQQQKEEVQPDVTQGLGKAAGRPAAKQHTQDEQASARVSQEEEVQPANTVGLSKAAGRPAARQHTQQEHPSAGVSEDLAPAGVSSSTCTSSGIEGTSTEAHAAGSDPQGRHKQNVLRGGGEEAASNQQPGRAGPTAVNRLELELVGAALQAYQQQRTQPELRAGTPPAAVEGITSRQRSSLYTSPFQHCAVSLKVYHPTKSHQEAASALTAAVPAALSAALPGHLLHTSSAWVKGCVHLFAWVSDQVAGQGPHAPPDANLSAILMQHLAAAAASAGAVGPVDVHVTGQPGPRRYHLPALTQAPGAPAAEAEGSIDNLGHALTDAFPPLALHQVVPPCLTLPDMQPSQAVTAASASAATLHLGTGVPQRVRVLLLTPASGLVLVDQEHDLGPGDGDSIDLHVPSWDAARAAHSPVGADDHALSAGASACLTFHALRLIITTPTHKPGSQQPPQLARLHATATLVAAPPPLASELCSLYETMMQQGGAIGLDAPAVWCLHWQPLMDSICLLSTLPGTAAEASTPQEQAQSTAMLTEAAHSLQTFFDLNSMPAWRAEVSCILARLNQQQARGQVEAPSADPQSDAQAATSPTSVPGNEQPPASGAAPRSSATSDHDQPELASTSGTAASRHGCNAAGCSRAGPSSPSKDKAAASSQPPPRLPPTPHPHRPRIRALHAWVLHCCRLLLLGFPDPGVEREWQSDISVTSARATDPGGLICQAGIFAANSMRAWRMGRLVHWHDASNVLLYWVHTLAWGGVLIWCIRYSRSRHTRAKAFLVAALGDLMWMVLTSLGLLSELGTLYRMSVSMRSTSGATILRCLQMQGTLRQWALIGAVLSVMWIPLQLQQGLTGPQAVQSAIVSWLLSCCLAAALEVWMRLSYLQQRRGHKQQDPQGGNQGSAPGKSKRAAASGTKASPGSSKKSR